MFIVRLTILALLVASCARAPIKTREAAMRPTDSPKQIGDDLDPKTLAIAIQKTIDGLNTKIKNGGVQMRFGPREVPMADYVASLKNLLNVINEATKYLPPNNAAVLDYIRSNFEFLEVYGDQSWSDVFITGYYEPVIDGSSKRTKKFSAPLLGLPKDMVIVDIPAFIHALPDLKGAPDAEGVPQKMTERTLRGRLVPSTDPNLPPTIEPYDPRALIENSQLKNKAKIIAWVDPIDAFFLQIQGSGSVSFKDKSQIRVSYVAQNGYPYVAIAQFVFDKIPKEQMTRQKLEAYLRSLPANEAKKIMDQNPSYVFFEKTTGARTLLGVEATGGRTIATDAHFFTKGALAYLEFQTPVFASQEATNPDHFQTTHRLVVDQDTGGAIRGPGRVDLFVGGGPDADRESGGMRQHGRLYYLIPKAKKLR